MKPFVFALEPLREVREREERSAGAALACALRDTAVHRARAAALAAERADIGRGLARPGVSPDFLRANFSRLEALAGQIARCEAALARAGERESQAGDVYRAARREHRKVALLRERALAAHEAERDAREANALDEANAARTASTSRASSLHI